MKRTQWLIFAGLVAGFATVVSDAQAGRAAKRQGTSVLHYMTRNTLVTTDGGTNGGTNVTITNVTGSLRLQFNEQGGASKQSFLLRASGLETNTTYNLIAIVGDDTNAVPASSFTTDSAGRACILYRARSQGRGGTNLPAALNPLTDIRSIGIEDASTQTVAFAWIADAEKFQYLVKRKLTPEDTNGTAAGSIFLSANQTRVFFKLLATGLEATNDYHLALDSNIVSTVTANTNGQVSIKSWPSNAPPVLELSSLALIDTSSNIVLSTTFPRESSPSGSGGLKRCWSPHGHAWSYWRALWERIRSHHDRAGDDDREGEGRGERD